MDRYVGLDAHAETCTLAVMGASGRRLTSRVVETNGHALVEAIRSIPGRVHLCLEEGAQSAWLYEILEPQVTEAVVTVPRESKGPKDDLRDGGHGRASFGRERFGRVSTRQPGPGRWRKMKGEALVRLPHGELRRAEVHSLHRDQG
jgi:hypothetical protein